jgi:DEAD/DEAH box helicase domain-containing protein
VTVAAADGPADLSPTVRTLLGLPDADGRARHVEHLPGRTAQRSSWPAWAAPEVVAALARAGVDRPWRHQRIAADLAWRGRDTVLATGTASGKTVGYLLPVLTAVGSADATAVYLSPTKALAADQLRRVGELGLPALRAGCYDGDTATAERGWLRAHANLLLTNPDMLHCTLLPGHDRWQRLLRRLRFVVVDECHVYRGVFGSQVAAVLRRLDRVCAHYGSAPTFLLASATTGDPAESAGRLLGRDVVAVTDDGSPRGGTDVVLWDAGGAGESPGAARSAAAAAADLLAALVRDGVRTVAFVGSRRGAESIALSTQRRLAESAPDRVRRVAAYRAGYLPEERRELERRLQRGSLVGLAATSALELGVDVSGLDAVLIAGYPGRSSSFWQQVGRAGRAGRRSTAVLIARDDPLDQYLVRHPETLLHRPVEATVLDPDNPYVLAGQLCAAAQELPLRDGDCDRFGPNADTVLANLTRSGLLRRRQDGWFWNRRGRASDLVDIRGAGAPAVAVVEDGTGRLLGTVPADAADAAVHTGAVYLHQGAAYRVLEFDVAAGVALVTPDGGEFATFARRLTEVCVIGVDDRVSAGEVSLCFGSVEVASQVVSFRRRRVVTGEILGEYPLDLPRRLLRTRAVWWTVTGAALAAAGVGEADLGGTVHAAEHAAIGLLPLVATCDRWDVGGLSTPAHPDTGAPTVFVYDGAAGGAGFAERGFGAANRWLAATRDAVAECGCADGCPGCVQSPKCGNGNFPLDKAGARILLDLVCRQLDRPPGAADVPARRLDLPTARSAGASTRR